MARIRTDLLSLQDVLDTAEDVVRRIESYGSMGKILRPENEIETLMAYAAEQNTGRPTSGQHRAPWRMWMSRG